MLSQRIIDAITVLEAAGRGSGKVPISRARTALIDAIEREMEIPIVLARQTIHELRGMAIRIGTGPKARELNDLAARLDQHLLRKRGVSL